MPAPTRQPSSAPGLPPSDPSPAKGEDPPARRDELGVAHPSAMRLPLEGEGRGPDAVRANALSDPSPGPSLLPLFAWLSPAFPVGAYAYSHGLEWAVEAGDIRDEETLGAWIADLMAHGFGRTDAILFAHAFDAAGAGDGVALAEINALAVALAPSAELRLETCQQGRSFLEAVRASWPAPVLDTLSRDGEVAYPVAVGLACAAHHLPKRSALGAFLLSLTQTLVSAGLRLAPVGQTAGTRIVARLAPAVEALAEAALTASLEDVGGATFRADLGSMRHETQYTRLFRS